MASRISDFASSALQTRAQPASLPLAQRVVNWQRQHGRHDLPWQNTRDPYRIWLSEIMLQQTQVSTVLGYYQRFLERFPSVTDLALAQQESVLELWSGLGYYTRARNLHRCAQALVEQHGGQFPRDLESLQALPGIGRSTAAAIAAFSFSLPSTILDGNVKRVLSRVFAVSGAPNRSVTEKQLWLLAERETPTDDIEVYTQGVMDLGATLCTRNKPRCGSCPLQSICVAYKNGSQELYPERKIRALTPTRHVSWWLLLRSPEQSPSGEWEVLMYKRGAGAVWEGLWCFPETIEPVSKIDQEEQIIYGKLDRENARALPTIFHAFSHYKLHATPRVLVKSNVIQEPGLEQSRVPHNETRWLARSQWSTAALPTPVKKFLLTENFLLS